MAGMLPGVECARRRRFHQSITSSDSSYTAAKPGSTRRSSFCLYASNRDSHHSSSSSQRSTLNQAYQNEELGGIAREAKERLDERLRTHRKPETIRQRQSREEVDLKGSEKKGKGKEGNEEEEGKKKIKWGKLKLRWRASEQEECAICLEGLMGGEAVVHLPCAHKFHSPCLAPWLQHHAHCPCCRIPIPSQ